MITIIKLLNFQSFKSKDWVYNVLEKYNLAEEPKLEDARKFVQSVVDYKSSPEVDPK